MLEQKLKTNVLIAIPCLLLGGTEYQTLNLVKALFNGGYRVVVLCYFEYDMRMVKYMENAGATVELMSVNGNRPKGTIKILWTLLKGFKNIINKHNPEIVHVQYLSPGTLSILLFKLLGVNHVLATAHVPGHIYKRKWIPQLIAKYVTDIFLCVSKSSEKDFFELEPEIYSKKLFLEGRKHFTLYNCTDTDVLIKKNKKDFFNIGVISRLSYEKGIDKLIDAMPIVFKQYPDTKLIIVGDGTQHKILENKVNEYNLSDKIFFEGLQPKENLEKYYNSFDIVVIPSRFEGFGLTAIEAMSYKIPVIASKTDGLIEVIDDEINGILVKNESSEEYAKQIIQLKNEPIKMEYLGNNGRKNVLEKFSFEVYEKQILDLYSLISVKKFNKEYNG